MREDKQIRLNSFQRLYYLAMTTWYLWATGQCDLEQPQPVRLEQLYPALVVAYADKFDIVKIMEANR